MTRARARISKDPEVRRVELLTAAGELFRQVGYERTSVQMITDAVGVAKGLFYHYFRSKADLLNQLVSWQTDRFTASLPEHAADMEGDSLQKLREIATRSTQWKFEDLRPPTRAYLEVMYQEENQALRFAFISEYTARLIPLFTEIIAEAEREGVCRVHDPELAAEQWLALGVGLGERLANLLLSLPEHPENLEALLARMHALEDGIERLLGMDTGTLQLYDYDLLSGTLTGLLQEERGSMKGNR